MSNRSIMTRIKDLENKHPERSWKPLFQDWDDPDLWHPDSRQNDEALTWDQVKAAYPNHNFIKVTYVTDWKPED